MQLYPSLSCFSAPPPAPGNRLFSASVTLLLSRYENTGQLRARESDRTAFLHHAQRYIQNGLKTLNLRPEPIKLLEENTSRKLSPGQRLEVWEIRGKEDSKPPALKTDGATRRGSGWPVGAEGRASGRRTHRDLPLSSLPGGCGAAVSPEPLERHVARLTQILHLESLSKEPSTPRLHFWELIDVLVLATNMHNSLLSNRKLIQIIRNWILQWLEWGWKKQVNPSRYLDSAWEIWAGNSVTLCPDFWPAGSLRR